MPKTLRNPQTSMPAGNLADYGAIRVVATRSAPDRPRRDEFVNPPVYRVVHVRGPKTPSELYYLAPHTARHGTRIYFEEARDNDA